MNHIIGLSAIMVWLLGFLTPHTLPGFIEILGGIFTINILYNKLYNQIVEKISSRKKVRHTRFKYSVSSN